MLKFKTIWLYMLTVLLVIVGGSVLLADALIYEPFDIEIGQALDDQQGGEGLGTWIQTESSGTPGKDFEGTNGLSYGSLPVTGNAVKASTSISGGRGYTNSTAALSAGGLLNDGATLWMSAIVQPLVGANASLVVMIGEDYVDGLYVINGGAGDAAGFNFQNGNHLQCRYTTNGTAFNPGDIQADCTLGQTLMIVVEMKWSSDNAQPDTINYYLPDSDLNIGPVKKTISTAVFDQSQFDTITISGFNQAGILDEIRFGGTYEAVIGVIDPPAGTVIVVR